MCEVIPFDAVARRSPASPPRPTQQMPFETYVAYQQAEAAFRALYFGRPLDTEALTNCPPTKIVQRHWSTAEQLANTLLREKKSLSRERVIKLLLHASLDRTVAVQP
jgi:hypothetical protein